MRLLFAFVSFVVFFLLCSLTVSSYLFNLLCHYILHLHSHRLSTIFQLHTSLPSPRYKWLPRPTARWWMAWWFAAAFSK
uniref:Putative secreted peptide n=1 Tax=Anopheles braziliensis TaxID=58242 RepID=A0A2M3ZQW2_9DIPT